MASLGLIGCAKEPASPEQVQQRLRSTIPNVLTEAQQSMGFVEDIPGPTWLERSMEIFDEAFASLPSFGPPADEPPEPPPGPEAAEPEWSGDELVDKLVDVVFNERSYMGDGIYRLRGDLACETIQEEVTNKCIREVDDAEIRFEAALAGDGLDIEMMVGPERSLPLFIQLRSDLIKAELNLGETKEVFEIREEEMGTPEVLRGSIAAAIRVHAPEDVSLSLSVTNNVRFETVTTNGDVPYEFSTQASEDPIFKVRFRNPQEKMLLDLDVGRTLLSMPWAPLGALYEGTEEDEYRAGDEFVVRLPGLTASTEIGIDTNTIRVTNIGLGNRPTTVSLDDQVLMSWRLNPEHGRRLDLTMRRNEADLANFVFQPRLEWVESYNLRPLAEAGHDIPEFLLDETYRTVFDGARRPTFAPEPANPDLGFPGGLRVVSGTLSLATSAPGVEPVIVEADQCLIALDAPPPGSHPYLGWLDVVDCP